MSEPDPCERLGSALTCRDCVAFLADYLEHALPADQLRIFEAHLDYCPDCRTYLDNYRRTVASARELGEAGAAEPAPRRLLDAILAARKHPHS